MSEQRHNNLTPAERDAILERDAYMCAYCMGEATEVDHIIPWSWRPNNSPDNLVACCRECNAVASNKMFDDLHKKIKYVRGVRGIHLGEMKDQCFCVDCKKAFKPRWEGSTNFQCADCARKYSGGRARAKHKQAF